MCHYIKTKCSLIYSFFFTTTHPLNIFYLWTNSSRKTAYIPWEHTIRGFRNCFQKNWGIPVSWENDTFSCSFGPKFRFWSHFGPLDPFFYQNYPPNAPIWWLAMFWVPISTFTGYLGHQICPWKPFWSTQFAKVGQKWAKFYVLCVCSCFNS